MYKAVIIGCGGRGGDHINAYKHIDNAHVVACQAPSPRRRDPLAEKHGIQPYADIEAMIRDVKPDIVHIITPPSVRVDVMTLVSELGVPLCTVEKPIATEVSDWRALLELERCAATKFAICHQFRWQPQLMKCRQAVASGKIGDVKFLDISAGMNIAGQGTHTLNYGRSLIGDPKVTRVFANVAEWDTNDRCHPGSATTEAMLTFDNGVRGLWTSGRVSMRCGNPDVVWQHVRAAAYGDHGRVNYEEFGNWEIISGSDRECGDFGDMGTWRANNDLAQAGFHKAMFNWLEDDSNAPGTNLADSLHEWAVVLALYQSALTHQPVDLAKFNPSVDLVDHVKKVAG